MSFFKSLKKLVGKSAPLVGGYFGGAFGAKAGQAIGGRLNRAKNQPNMTAQPVEIVPTAAAPMPQSFDTSSPLQPAGFNRIGVENAGSVENAEPSNKNLPLIGVGLLAVYVLAKGHK